MKAFIASLLVLLTCSVGAIAQTRLKVEKDGVLISNGNQKADASAILDIQTTKGGVLLPRMTSSERNAIPAPATGLMVYVSDQAAFYYNAGSPAKPNWSRVGDSNPNAAARIAATDTWGDFQSNGIRNLNPGGVLIGDSIAIPAGYKLYVNGGILTNRLKIAFPNSALWADYVFEPTYQLRSLPEVEKFIQANKHLPDVPSAKQVSEQGVDVTAMQALLLQKIEELTLYQIEMEKRLNRLDQENAALRMGKKE